MQNSHMKPCNHFIEQQHCSKQNKTKKSIKIQANRKESNAFPAGYLQKIKCLEININQEVKNLFNENYNNLVKNSEDPIHK